MCVTMPSVGFIVYSGHKAKEKMRVEQSKKQEAKAQLMAEKVIVIFPRSSQADLFLVVETRKTSSKWNIGKWYNWWKPTCSS